VALKTLNNEKVFLKHLLQRQEGSHTWYACPHSTWERKTGLTRRQVRWLEDRMVKLDIIETIVKRVHETPIKHYRVRRERALVRLHLIDNLLWHEVPQTVEEMDAAIKTTSGMASGMANPIYTGLPLEEVETQQNYLHSTSNAIALQEPMTPNDMGEPTISTSSNKHSSQILKELKEKIVNPHAGACASAGGKVTPLVLSKLWIKTVAEVQDTVLHRPHGMKELGMLKHYLKFTGDNAAPALVWAVRNWARYRYRAQEELGESLPSTPRVGALLRGCEAAVRWYLKDEAKKQVAPTPVESPQLQISAQPGVVETKATKAEIEQYLKDTKDED